METERWSQFWQVVKTEWRSVPDKEQAPLAERFERFGGLHENADRTELCLSRVSRGYQQLRNARDWAQPEVGGSPGSRTRTDRVRGVQWRFVIAYSGFETFVRGVLLRERGAGLKETHFQKFVNATRPIAPPSLPGPTNSLQDEQRGWIDRHGRDVLEFLSAGRLVEESLRGFLGRGEKAETWIDLTLVATGLRHISAHGALSPAKVAEWGLLPTFEALPGHLTNLVDQAVDRLLEPQDGATSEAAEQTVSH